MFKFVRTPIRALALGFCLTLSVVIATGAAAQQSPKVLAIGDSLMASHAISGRSIADYLQVGLGARVVDRSVLGAHMVYRLPITGAMGLSIPAQFRGKGWDWVVMTGGGNDLWLGCGCGRCDRRMNRLIAASGTRGALPSLFARIQKSGAQVIYVGYLRSPGIITPIEHCKDEGDELEARIARLAARIEGVHYISIQDLVPRGDTSYFALDGIHPSIKASREIAGRITAYMLQQ
ncbi:MAG: SGNH/GDSL hydrolase family protein [Rhodobacteraceae bacterium]|nr:SGNH/GDSL hydrolase family protein [Paracoccaceae bacterium]